MRDAPVQIEAHEYEAGKLGVSVRGTAHEASTANRHGSYVGHRAVLATMHGKEGAISAVLFDRLGFVVGTAPKLETDVLGTGRATPSPPSRAGGADRWSTCQGRQKPQSRRTSIHAPDRCWVPDVQVTSTSAPTALEAQHSYDSGAHGIKTIIAPAP